MLWERHGITQCKAGLWSLQWASVGSACTVATLPYSKWHLDFPLGNQPSSMMSSLGGAVNQGAQLSPWPRSGMRPKISQSHSFSWEFDS